MGLTESEDLKCAYVADIGPSTLNTICWYARVYLLMETIKQDRRGILQHVRSLS